MKIYLDQMGIPEELQTDVIKLFIDSMAEQTLQLADKRDGFVVVDTRGTLRGQKCWNDEIHPDTRGFKKIAEVIYLRVVKLYSQLRDK